jgi:hypothetical protein
MYLLALCVFASTYSTFSRNPEYSATVNPAAVAAVTLD